MNRVRARAATVFAGACLAATLVAVPSAQAAVTQSSITTPADLSYYVYEYNNPNTFAVAGTSNGTTGDHVDLVCYYGSHQSTVASNVAVQSNGSFSAPTASLRNANVYSPCQLRAIPTGSTPGNLAPFAGPKVMVGYNRTYRLSGGPNDGELYDYYSFFQQLAGGMDYDSLASCGIDDGYLSDSAGNLTTYTWWCNAALFRGEANPATRSELQVDGANAYPPYAAQRNNSQGTGFRPLSYSYTLDSKTGDAVIHETDPIVKCADATYPPTTVSCATFVATGVTDYRTIVQTQQGRVAWITDVFKSTDGKAHTLDLLWDNYERFWRNTGDSTQLEYQFPGQSGYSMHVVNDTISLPARPGTVLVRMHGVADGDTSTGRGALVYDRPATVAKFNYVSTGSEDFTLHQTAKIPAHGSTRFRFAYVQDYTQATVNSLAQVATTVFKGCTVPKVKGKSLVFAKAAITHANCTVGKIAKAWSSTVKKGAVISSAPKAGSHVDYHAKVALTVSKGKKK